MFVLQVCSCSDWEQHGVVKKEAGMGLLVKPAIFTVTVCFDVYLQYRSTQCIGYIFTSYCLIPYFKTVFSISHHISQLLAQVHSISTDHEVSVMYSSQTIASLTCLPCMPALYAYAQIWYGIVVILLTYAATG